ncbi:MAG: methyltransferase domain-containing protein [Acidobacteria bacterium]|nr:methyltransferase domain-containing protein [Acidobacteriota bacterium]
MTLLSRWRTRIRDCRHALRRRIEPWFGPPRPGSAAYARRQREEIEHYGAHFLSDTPESAASRVSLLQPVPPVWEEVMARSAEYLRARTGDDIPGHLTRLLRRAPGQRLLSLGSGPGGVELVLAREAPEAEYVCLDLNPDLLTLGARSAEAEGLPVRFAECDLNTIDLAGNDFDLVLCHASLHHVVELERLMDQIRRTLRADGKLVVVDVVTRDGGRMAPSTAKVADAIFRTLPARYRLNHTAYSDKRLDTALWQADTRATGMECIRSGDVLPLLRKQFREELFAGYLSLARRFFESMYGPNFDLTRQPDRAIFDWVWELDCHYLATGELPPESFFGIYSAAPPLRVPEAVRYD